MKNKLSTIETILAIILLIQSIMVGLQGSVLNIVVSVIYLGIIFGVLKKKKFGCVGGIILSSLNILSAIFFLVLGVITTNSFDIIIIAALITFIISGTILALSIICYNKLSKQAIQSTGL